MEKTYRTVHQLSRDELDELKELYVRYTPQGRRYGDVSAVSDELILAHYAADRFQSRDFACNSGKEE